MLLLLQIGCICGHLFHFADQVNINLNHLLRGLFEHLAVLHDHSIFMLQLCCLLALKGSLSSDSDS